MIFEWLNRWLFGETEQQRRFRKYVNISSGYVSIDPRYYTESPKWDEMMRNCRRLSRGGLTR